MELPSAGQRNEQGFGSSRVSTILVRALVEAVVAEGVGADELLREASAEHPQWTNPYGWVELAEFDRLVSCAVELTGDPAFGLHWAERSPMMKFDVLAMSTAYAPTLGEGLACLLRFQSLVTERPEFEIVKRAQSVFLRIVPLATTELSRRVRVEVGVAGLVRLMRYAGGPGAGLRSIAFAHRAPSYVQEYTRLFGGRVRFGQAYSGVEIDPVWLERPLHNVNAELHRTLTAQAQQALARLKSSAGYAGQVRDRLLHLLPRLPGMREMARALSLSERSLRRRLAEEGRSYSEILHESRLLLARQLLADPTRTLQQVAFDVGFASPEAFHHAFKRWTGQSPAAFRSTTAREGIANTSNPIAVEQRRRKVP